VQEEASRGEGETLLMAAALHRSRAQGATAMQGREGRRCSWWRARAQGRAKACMGGVAAGGRAGGGDAGGPREETAAQGQRRGVWRSWWSCAAPGRDAGR
jgi:hypothetical protein